MVTLFEMMGAVAVALVSAALQAARGGRFTSTLDTVQHSMAVCSASSVVFHLDVYSEWWQESITLCRMRTRKKERIEEKKLVG
jgi:hypothetical protein